jgi:hypothetical protein
MTYKDLTDFMKKFDKKFATKPKRVGLPELSFRELEKDLADLAPTGYQAWYENGEHISILGVEIFNSEYKPSRRNDANIELHNS